MTTLYFMSPGTAPSTRTELTESDYKAIMEELVKVKSQWKPIAVELGFLPHEIQDISFNQVHAHDNNYIYDVITRWLQWAPGDGRGSKDIATLEALQDALNKTNNAKIKVTL